MTAPVLLLAFNRPELTIQVFDAIRRYRPTRLYFSVDGVRNHVPSDHERVRATREIISNIDWPCTVKTKYSETNLGCKTAVSQAINWFFETEDEGIILEDDCLPNPSFFPFCNEMLNRYRNDLRVMLVTGESYGGVFPRVNSFSYSYSRYALIWGWATWRRAWNLYEGNMLNWQSDSSQEWPERFFKRPEVANYWRTQFSRVASDPDYTWDYQWIYSCLTNSGLCVVPRTNLIKNIGCGENATHTLQADWHLANRPTLDLEFPLKHPPKVKFDVELDLNIEMERFEIHEPSQSAIVSTKPVNFEHVQQTPSSLKRILRKLRTKLCVYRKKSPSSKKTQIKKLSSTNSLP